MRSFVPIVLVFVAVGAVVLFVPVQPMYASSDSMAPAIQTGDLYFIERGRVAQPGAIIAFESATRDELVTHRVVGEKPAGYVTKGDANPSTDQEAGHPVVSRSAVLGTVIQVNGRPVTIGGVGPLAAWLAAYRWFLFGIGVVLALVLVVRDLFDTERVVPNRTIVQVSDIVTPLFIGCLLISLLFVYWGGSSHELNYVATAGDVTSVQTVPVGEAARRTVSLDTVSLPFTTIIVEAHGVSVLERSATPTGLELFLEVPAQSSTGLYQASVDVGTYPATLPRGVIVWLHQLHWLAAGIGTIAPLLGPVYLLYAVFVDGGMPVRSPRSRWLRRLDWR